MELTVKDLRRAIQDLPNSAKVTIKPSGMALDSSWARHQRVIAKAVSAHDGRYGPVLHLELGGFCIPWGTIEEPGDDKGFLP